MFLINQKQKISSEIYLEIGYENLSSFIQAYKVKFGSTPKQHQKTRTFSNTFWASLSNKTIAKSLNLYKT